MWLGRRGASAPCHYDGYHNAFSQLHGRKRFVLLPPSATALLRPFPFLHPSHAQCQAELPVLDPAELAAAGALEADRYMLAIIVTPVTSLRPSHPAGALEAVLQPGDVLYLPPLWFHETEVRDDLRRSPPTATSTR